MQSRATSDMELFMTGQGQPFDLYIMRGIPGCGKSHRANRLLAGFIQAGWTADIFSADHFYGEGEQYKKNWSPQKAHLGHRDCEAKVLSAMKRNVFPAAIIVDNTNLYLSGFRTYLDYAVDHGYAVQFVYPDSPWWIDTVEPFLRQKKDDEESIRRAGEIAKFLFDKSVHGVPESTLANMLMRFQWVTFKDYVEATKQRVVTLERELGEMRLRAERLEKRLS